MYSIDEQNGLTVVHYYYPFEKIQEEVHKRTSYLGRFRNREDAAHLLDLLTMSKDESDLFESFLRTGMSLIFSAIGKRTRHIEKAYNYEKREPGEVVDRFDNSMHYVIEWGEQYNSNFIEPIDQHIFDAIVFYIIWRWLFMIGFFDDGKIFEDNFNKAIQDIEKETGRLVGSIVNKIPRIF